MTRRFTPLAALLGATLSLSACWSGVDVDLGNDGVPLADLEIENQDIDGIELSGPDDVVVTTGSAFSVTAEGDPDAVSALRFSIDGDTLSVNRASAFSGSGHAIVRVTMPTIGTAALAGSGDLSIDGANGESLDFSLAGSGDITAAGIDAEAVSISIAGSGGVKLVGNSVATDISIAGSGDVDGRTFTTERADISIAGSGDVRLASNGTIEASIMGSGDVYVTGSATCKESAMGSGGLHCAPAQAAATPASDASSPAAGD